MPHESASPPRRSGRRRRQAPRALAALLVAALALAGCGSDDTDEVGSDDTDTPTTETEGTETTTDGDTGGDASVPRPATVTWGDEERTFALAMCDLPTTEDLLVSGTDDEGLVLVIQVTSGSGEVYVSDADAVEDVLAGQVEEFAVESDGTFSASGSATAANGATSFTMSGDCDAAPGG